MRERPYDLSVRLRPSSLRSRLVAVFAIGSSILLLLAVALLYLRFNVQLEEAIDQALRDRAADIALDIHEGNIQIRAGEPFAELLDPSGTVIDATVTGARRNPVLNSKELNSARSREVVVNRLDVTGLGDRGRILARPETTTDGRRIIIVVGESFDAVVRARERFGVGLGIASPVVIGAIAWFGWVLAGAALRPVRRLTEEADAISLREGGQRLAQPPGDDEIAHLGRTLNRMLDRIEASVAHERAFVDDASHELRTPISILRAELELAGDRPADTTEIQAALASALQEAVRLGRLTEDLLVLARADRDGLDGRGGSVDVLAAAERSSRRHRLRDGTAIEVVGENVVANAEVTALERVLDNLLANAVRYATARVQVAVAREGDWVRITVADDGRGFPPEFLPVALDRFTRADPDRGRHRGGTGLGLAIVAALVSARRGRVSVANDGPLGGACVTVELPAGEALMVSSSP